MLRDWWWSAAACCARLRRLPSLLNPGDTSAHPAMLVDSVVCCAEHYSCRQCGAVRHLPDYHPVQLMLAVQSLYYDGANARPSLLTPGPCRYRALVRDADAHKSQAAEAATAAKRYAGEYQTQMKEAQIHGDRHKELWREAEMYAPSPVLSGCSHIAPIPSLLSARCCT